MLSLDTLKTPTVRKSKVTCPTIHCKYILNTFLLSET